MIKILSFLLLALLIACNNRMSRTSSAQNRDSIMSKYFEVIDSLGYNDTLDQPFKLLKAYYNNDTVYLKKSYDSIATFLKFSNTVRNTTICEEPAELNTLGFKEAYRFIYEAAFCDTSVTMTIGKNSDSIVLDLYLYQFNNEKVPCRTINHIIKLMNKNTWDTLLNGIVQADFWGLKEDNGRFGMDGSELIVTGYLRPINAFEGGFKKIHRWAAEDMAIGILFKKMLDLSGIKVDCFHYR